MELVSTDGFDEGARWCEANDEMGAVGAYPFSKKAINAWVASRAATLITDGIRLNCINPGPTDTAMLPHFVKFAGQNIIDAFVGPIRRRSTAEEQAWPLIFLNSPRSSYVNGEALVTDGDSSARCSPVNSTSPSCSTPQTSTPPELDGYSTSPECSAARDLDEACHQRGQRQAVREIAPCWTNTDTCLRSSLLNSQQNGGGIFLIFVADPRTMWMRSPAFPEVLQRVVPPTRH